MFKRYAEREFEWAEEKRLTRLHLNHFGQCCCVLAQVNMGDVVVAEHAHLAAEAQINAGRLNRIRGERLDANAPSLDLVSHRAVAEEHVASRGGQRRPTETPRMNGVAELAST
jgi:hypothetical protein